MTLLDAMSSSAEDWQDHLKFTSGDPTATAAQWSPVADSGSDLTMDNGLAAQLVASPMADGPVINIDQPWLDARGPGPYYLDQAGTTYVLQTNVTTAGTAFAILANDVVFDLNGYTITYDNAAPITVPNGSFEAGTGSVATGWDFSTAPGASRYQGVWLHNEVYDGNYSLKFALPNGNQHVTSTSTITLQANTTYSLSAMFEYGGQGDTENPGVKAYVRLVGSGLTTREVSWSSTNWRGIQLQEGTFTTGNSSETYNVQVGIEGGTSVPATACYIDDIKIQRTKTYGIATQAFGWSSWYPDLDRYGQGTGATIQNGRIVQGTDGGTWGHAVLIHQTDGITLHGLEITVNGANSSAVYGLDQGTAVTNIYGNTLTSNVSTITSRDNFNGAVIYALQGNIHHNTITNGVHAGIYTSGGTAGNRIASNVYSNTIQLKSRYTNGFAILAGYGSQIYDNTINCGTGEYSARGIGASGEDGLAATRVYGNTIEVQGYGNNQEYEGVPIGGAYGIQLENAHNVEVYDNRVTARGNATVAYAFRMNSDEGTSADVYVHGNTFEAVSNGSHAAAIKVTGIEPNSLRFEDNTLLTNDGIVGTTSDAIFTLTRSHLQINTPIADPYPIESDYSGNPALHTIISFLDTTFEDAASRNYLGSATARTGSRFGGLPDNRIAFNQQWTTTVRVNESGGAPVPNAQVIITDKSGNQVFSGSTDANGEVVAVLTEFQTQGSIKTGYNPFTVTVNFNGQQPQQQFTADQRQTVGVQVNGNVLNDAPSGANKTVATPEDTAYTFTAADFGFSDPNDSPPNSLLAIKIATLPSLGTLTNNGLAVTNGQFVSLADITSGRLKFTPAAGASGTAYASFTFQVQDNGGTANGGVDLDPTPNTVTVDVTGVNDAPSGTNKTVATVEDTVYTFTAADFGFSDPSDSPANSLLAVRIATLPSTGQLTNNGVAVNTGQSIVLADITAGRLKFTPAAGASGTGYASFTFQVQDNGGTANGGVDLDPTPNIITVNVTALNDAPSGTNKTVSTMEGTAYTFTAADFGFSDPSDSPANSLLAVRIATLPSAGQLTNNGAAVNAGQSISLADLNGGKLKFTPAAGASGTGYAGFTFQVQDNGGTANGGVDLDPTPNTITVDVTAATSGLVGLWQFNDNSGSGASDASGNGNHAFLQGGALITEGVLALTAANQRAVAADSPTLDIANTITIAAWISPTSKSTQSVVSKAVQGSINGYELALSNSGTVFVRFNQVSSGDAYRLDSTTSYPTNGSAWLHVTATYDGAMIRLYINGQLQATKAAGFTIATNNVALGIGAEASGARSMRGKIDDVLIANRAFSASEVLAAYQGIYPNGGDTNTAPSVNAGVDIAAQIGQSVNLNGAVTDDGLPDWSAVSSQWALVSGPGSVNFNNAQSLTTTATFNAAGTYVLRLTAFDGALSASDDVVVTVVAVNHAPSGADRIVITASGSAYTFTAADFGFSDSNDSPANNLAAVKIAALPTAGSLTNNGTPVNAGQAIVLADIASGKLKFTPASGASGTGYASFTFQVQDNGGTANGGLDLDPTPNTITIDVASAASGLVGLWQFNDGSGSTANDVSGSGNHGTLQGGASFGAGQSGGGLVLNGSTTLPQPIGVVYPRVVVADAPSLDISQAITIGAWISPSSRSTQSVVSKAIQGSVNGYELSLSASGKVFVRFNQASSGDTYRLDSTASYPTNGSTWMHVVATYDGTTIRLYVNGQLQGTKSATFSIGTNNVALGIGAEASGDRAMRGRIDDVLIANRALSANEVADVYQFGYPVSSSPNAAPAGTDRTITLREDSAYTFTTDDFGFTDPNNSPADALKAVRISTLPSAGQLTVDGVAATTGQWVAVASILGGKLRYTPTIDVLAPIPSGFTFQVQDTGGTANGGSDVDPTPNTLTLDVGRSPELNFVRGLYAEILGRAPDLGGLLTWYGQLKGGASTQSIATGLWSTYEHRGIQVDSYYQAFFDRAADPFGREFWITHMMSGMTEEDVMTAFTVTTEYRNRYALPAEYATAVYRDLLGRDPNAAEQAAVVSQIGQPNANLAQVSKGLINSHERHLKVVDAFYDEYFGRDLDAAGESQWVGQLDQGLIGEKDLAIDLLATAEFYQRVN